MKKYKIISGFYADATNQHIEKAVGEGWQLLGPVVPNAAGVLTATMYMEVVKH